MHEAPLLALLTTVAVPLAIPTSQSSTTHLFPNRRMLLALSGLGATSELSRKLPKADTESSSVAVIATFIFVVTQIPAVHKHRTWFSDLAAYLSMHVWPVRQSDR